MTLGERVKEIRAAQRITQERLAYKADVSRVTIAWLEKGSQEHTTGQNVVKLAREGSRHRHRARRCLDQSYMTQATAGSRTRENAAVRIVSQRARQINEPETGAVLAPLVCHDVAYADLIGTTAI